MSVTITFDAKHGAFLIESPPWDVARARALPNRRWVKAKRLWRAPAIRANAEYILLRYKDAVMDESTRAALDAATRPADPDKFPGPPVFLYKTEPKPHQREAGATVYPLHAAALFMGCRTGKSKVLIDDFNAHYSAGRVDAAVVICPYSIRRNWLKELAKHSFLVPRTFVLGPIATKGEMAALDAFISTKEKRPDWLIVGVESLSQGKAHAHIERFLLARRAWMAIDESSRIKNHGSNRTEEGIRLGKMALIRRIGTGSSITKGIQDLFAQFEFLDDRIIGIGDYYSFRNRYCVMGGFNGKEIVGYDNTDELMDLLRPYTVQMDTRDVLDLPPKDAELRTVQMTAEQKRLYREVKNSVAMVGDVALKVQNCLERALRWQQIADGFYSWTEPDPLNPKKPRVRTADIPGGCPKLTELLGLIEEHDGMSTIVWTPYKHNIARIAGELRKRYGQDSVVEYHGGIEDELRYSGIARFNDKAVRFFIGNPATGGIGIDLPGGELEVYYSNSPNYEDRYQSGWRTTHMEATHIVKSVDLAVEHSIDEDVLAAFDLKKSLAEYVKDRLRAGQKPFEYADQ